jgi:hypothetical protein
MLKNIKRRRVDELEDNENESKLPKPRTSKAGKEATGEKIRLYNDSYFAIGFTWTGEENCLLPLCIVCKSIEKLTSVFDFLS